MMTVRRSKDGMGADSFAISGPRDFKCAIFFPLYFTQGAKVSAVTDDVHAVLCRHEGHLDNSGGDGSSFGALLSDKSFLELMGNDETAGIRPADGGQDSLSSHRLWAALLTYPVSAQARS